MPVTRGGQEPPPVEERQLEKVAPPEIERGEGFRLCALGSGRQRPQATVGLDDLAEDLPAAATVDLQVGQHREVVDPHDGGPDGLRRLAQRDRQIETEVANLVAETDRLDRRLPADGAGETAHGIGDVEQPGVRADVCHVAAMPTSTGTLRSDRLMPPGPTVSPTDWRIP